MKRASVVTFVNTHLPPNWMPIPPYCVVDFESADVGEGLTARFILLDISGRGYSNTLIIYQKNSGGDFTFSQEVDGWKMGLLKQMIRDLNGDGRDELIVPEALGPRGVWNPLMAMPVWPAVYRLKNGKYAEDSRDFSKYYDNEVLPSLEKGIATANSHGFRDRAAEDQLEINKILRVLGRNPTAGLNESYHWMKSSDPTLMECALATFSDIGRHEQEVRQLGKAVPIAFQRAIEARKGG
jgi:hypothetical protein